MAIKNLYIIGNGFDLHHQINSSYSHFSSWLKENKKEVYDEIVKLYGNKVLDLEWWGDFEENLGYFDMREQIEEYSYVNHPSEDDIEKCRSFDTMGAACDVREYVGGVINKIKACFVEWVNSFNSPNTQRKIVIKKENSYFINFNYSATLENIYGVKSNEICYIHMRNDYSGIEYIIGHGRDFADIKDDVEPCFPPFNPHKDDPSEYGIDANDDEITNNAKDEMINQVMSIQKPVEAIIKDLELSLFNRFKAVQNVYIFGLSFSKVDLPYIEAILKIIPCNSIFYISYFSKRDKDNINDFMQNRNIANNRFKLVRLEDLQVIKQLKLSLN